MRRKHLSLFMGPLVLTIASCSGGSTQEEDHQSIYVTTPGADGASCEIEDRTGRKYYVQGTPGPASVPPGAGPLQVTCMKPGYAEGTSIVHARRGEGVSETSIGEDMLAFVGLADDESGSTDKGLFPGEIVVYMKPVTRGPEVARPDRAAGGRSYGHTLRPQTATGTPYGQGTADPYESARQRQGGSGGTGSALLGQGSGAYTATQRFDRTGDPAYAPRPQARVGYSRNYGGAAGMTPSYSQSAGPLSGQRSVATAMPSGSGYGGSRGSLMGDGQSIDRYSNIPTPSRQPRPDPRYGAGPSTGNALMGDNYSRSFEAAGRPIPPAGIGDALLGQGGGNSGYVGRGGAPLNRDLARGQSSGNYLAPGRSSPSPSPSPAYSGGAQSGYGAGRAGYGSGARAYQGGPTPYQGSPTPGTTNRAAPSSAPGASPSPSSGPSGGRSYARTFGDFSLDSGSRGSDTASSAGSNTGSSSTISTAPPSSGAFSIQVGAYRDQANAEQRASILRARGYEAVVVSGEDRKGQSWSRVRLGAYDDFAAANSAAKQLSSQLGLDAVAVRN